jgi:peptidoglycan/xylan/chitin deacetylase (PgdA/CDA1 family)
MHFMEGNRFEMGGTLGDTGAPSEVPILLYHSVSDYGPPELARFRVTPAAFRLQLHYLEELGYHSISLDDWAASLVGGAKLRGRPVIITFDDGYRNFIENAWPILQGVNCSATIFVVTGKIGQKANWENVARQLELLSWDELGELRRQGACIASHGISHTDFLQLSREDVLREGRDARATLRERLGIEVSAIAFPYGNSNASVRAALVEAGYSIGVSCRVGMSTLADDPMNLPRIEVFGDDDLDSFAHKICGSSSAPLIGQSVDSRQSDAISFNPSRANLGNYVRMLTLESNGKAISHDVARRFAARLDALIGEFVSLHAELLQAAPSPTLDKVLVGLVSQPLISRTDLRIEPYQPITPGVVIGFEKSAEVHLAVEPKRDHTRSPESCLNTLTLSFKGTSQWLTLEAYFEWSEFCSAKRYQLGFYGEPNRTVRCRTALRLPQSGGTFIDHDVVQFNLTEGSRSFNGGGELMLPQLTNIDLGSKPSLLFFFDTNADLTIEFDYLTLHFA